jgi:hypothetical protein
LLTLLLLLLLLLLLQIAGPIMRGIRGMSSLLLESEDAGFLLQVRRRGSSQYANAQTSLQQG